jgi:5-methylcytosine-specific restriction endonuclease McrA
MPIDYKKYSPSWKTKIRPDILERDNHCCKECGVKNYSVGYWGIDGRFYDAGTIFNALEETGYDYFAHELSNVNCMQKPIKIVLTIAHLDHDVTNNNYANLAALCQRHHLAYDKEYHMKNSRETNRVKKGLQNMF